METPHDILDSKLNKLHHKAPYFVEHRTKDCGEDYMWFSFYHLDHDISYGWNYNGQTQYDLYNEVEVLENYEGVVSELELLNDKELEAKESEFDND